MNIEKVEMRQNKKVFKQYGTKLAYHKFLFTGIQPPFADALHKIIEIIPNTIPQQNQRIDRDFG